MLGEFEGTMLETFAASSHFKALIHQHQDIPAIHKYRSLLEVAAKDNSRDPFTRALLKQDSAQPNSRASGEPVSTRALAALTAYYAEYFPSQPLPSWISYSKYTLGKFVYTTYTTSTTDCNISFTSGNIQRPGIIRFVVADCSSQNFFSSSNRTRL